VKVDSTEIEGVVVIEPVIHSDARGFFLETYRQARYREAGVDVTFVQDNLSRSVRNTVRGLHLQHPTDQAKLVWVVEGEVLDVAVDVRVGSPTFGQYVSVLLDAERKKQLFVPAGFAHGFAVRSETALFAYKCSAPFTAEHAIGIAWNDPELAVDWGVTDPSLSAADAEAPTLSEVRARLPRWAGP